MRFLAYHSVAKPEQMADLQRVTLAVPDSAFVRHLEMIRKLGYSVISMDEALEMLNKGTAGAGQYVCLTFDDGRIDNLECAWPIVRRFGYTAHFFVSSGLIGQTVETRIGEHVIADRYIDPAGLRSMIGEGASIGSHGRTHRNLTTINDDDDLQLELRTSRLELEEITNRPVLTCAYPWSRYNDRVVDATRAAGYEFGFGVNTATAEAVAANERYEMPRNAIRDGDALENYLLIQGGYDFAAAYTSWKRKAVA